MQIAQTNLQLYNQLRVAKLPLEDLLLVHRAYELVSSLYSGYYQADGKPFVAHSVGVASIVAALDQPAELVAVGLLHNAYGNADFGDGRASGPTPARRRLVRGTVGERVEDLLIRFREVRLGSGRIEDRHRALAASDDTTRRLLLVELADHLEKYVDLGVLYFGRNDWVLGMNDRVGAELVELAREAGSPKLAEMLSAAFEEVARQAPHVPDELRPSNGRAYLELVTPRSCSRRLTIRLRARAQRVRDVLRPRTRLRELRAARPRRA
jgi:HD domain